MSASSTVHIDQKLFREVTGHHPTGVALVTGVDAGGELLALVVGTFSSVSLDPPLVSFMPMKTSRTFEKMKACASLSVNILGGEQEHQVLTIAQRWENRFEGIDWFASPAGNPVLTDSIAWIDARPFKTVDAGDHWIVLLEVTDMAVTNPVAPLIFFQGGYGCFVCTSLMARMDHEILPTIHATSGARGDIEALATRLGCEVSVLTAIGSEEMTVVLSAMAPGLNCERSLAQRIPLIPPIGDTFMFDRTADEQRRWIAKLRDCSAEQASIFLQRLDFLRERGYAAAFNPPDGSDAYAELRAATKLFESGRMTPAQERRLLASIRDSRIDYRVREIEDDTHYDIGSLVLPVRDAQGQYTLTLRLSHLRQGVTGAEMQRWLQDARSTVTLLEKAGTR